MVSLESRADPFIEVVERHGSEAACEWLRRALPSPGRAFSRERFLAFYSGAGRRFRGADLKLSAAEEGRLRDIGVLAPRLWSLDETARAALLLSAWPCMPHDEHGTFVKEVFRKGDNGERCALLRVLVHFPSPARFLITAIEACGTHVLDVFEAIACENPYPAFYFPDPNFNQLVLKALFLGVRVSRLHDWAQRWNSDLLRMVEDYAAELHAAGRSVPEDISLITSRSGL